MSRYLYGVAASALVVGALFFFYKTPPTPVPPQLSTAEFGGVSLKIELATTAVAREKGLGGRVSIPDDYGMLFVFPKDDLYGFWMKDTLVPLDMFWLDAQGYVISIASDVATSSFPTVFYPAAPARYVLETDAGFARAHAVATGNPFSLKNIPIVSE